MSTSIKSRLIAKIDQIESEEYLSAILEFIEDSDKSPVRLSENDIQHIQRSKEEIKRGDYISSQALHDQVGQCLGK